ncbi:hypothetical protein Dimus_011314 [Dionaea muscipula]
MSWGSLKNPKCIKPSCFPHLSHVSNCGVTGVGACVDISASEPSELLLVSAPLLSLGSSKETVFVKGRSFPCKMLIIDVSIFFYIGEGGYGTADVKQHPISSTRFHYHENLCKSSADDDDGEAHSPRWQTRRSQKIQLKIKTKLISSTKIKSKFNQNQHSN